VVPDQGVRIFRPQVGRRQDDVKEEDLWHLDEIGLLAARRNGFTGTGAGVEVAVLDTGADPAHPELAGKIAEHHVFDPATGSIVKARDGEDTDGHGTLVAGLLCGGKVGVAPGARVVSVAMLPRGQGGLANFSAALNWAATRGGLRILNISAGLPGLVPVLRNQLQALHDVGILPVVATGDGGIHRLTYSPGNLRKALSVGASARDEDGPWIPAFSSGGSLKDEDGTPYVIPDLVAPGQVVVSARQRGGYAFFNGTSLSAPIVAGVAALIIEKNSGIAVDSLVQALLDSCASLPQPLPEREGAGVVSIKPVFP
jgi:subtilisin family serine protease